MEDVRALRAVFVWLELPALAAAAQVCRLWRDALEGSRDDDGMEEDGGGGGDVWRAVALRLLPCWHVSGEEETEETAANSSDGRDDRSIEERKRQLWGRPVAVAPDVPSHRWKQTLRCVVEVFQRAGQLLENGFTLDAWHDMQGSDRGWDYDVWHHALHMLQQHDIIVKKGREVHSYGVSDLGRVCLTEGSPEMVTYERVPPGEGMRMVDLKEWAANRDVKGINQALALGWIVIVDEVEDSVKRERAAADPLVLTKHKSLARVLRNVESPKDEVREHLTLIDRHSHQDNRSLLPKEVYATLKRRKLIYNKIARTYRMSRGVRFVSSVSEIFRIFRARHDSLHSAGPADHGSPRCDAALVVDSDLASPSSGNATTESGEVRETMFSHKTKYFQMHKGFFREERDVVTTVDDMLMAIHKIAKYTATVGDLDHWLHADAEVVADAVFHNLVLLGEAGGIVMNELLRREKENDRPIPRPEGLDWEELVVMRNNIIHKYFIFHNELTRHTRMKQAWNLTRKLIEHGRPALRALRLAFERTPSLQEQLRHNASA